MTLTQKLSLTKCTHRNHYTYAQLTKTTTMETITKKFEVYDYVQLPEDVKEKIREQIRTSEWYPGDWWHEGMVEDFVEDMQKQGWDLDSTDVHFDVSYCQGSGASFDATLDVYKYLKANRLCTKFPRINRWAKLGQILGQTHKNQYANHYCHFNTRYFELETDVYYNELTAEAEEKLNDEIKKLESIIEEDREQICRDLEKKAYETWEHFMKDEIIDEDLIANEHRYEIDGTPYYD